MHPDDERKTVTFTVKMSNNERKRVSELTKRLKRKYFAYRAEVLRAVLLEHMADDEWLDRYVLNDEHRKFAKIADSYWKQRHNYKTLKEFYKKPRGKMGS